MVDQSTRLSDEQVAALRPMIHQHVTLLTAGGMASMDALAVAAESVALAYSSLCDDALRHAFEAIGVEPRGVPAPNAE